MIKKIIKSAVVLLSAGMIAAPAFAAEWGVSGQVRVDWDIMKSIEEKGSSNVLESDGGYKKRAPIGTIVQGGDTWVSFDLKGDNASGSLLYYGNGRVEYVGSGSAEAGNWTANVKVSVRDDSLNSGTTTPRAGDSVSSTKAGDQTVEVTNGGFSLKLGFTTPLDSFRQGRSYLLMGQDGAISHTASSDFGVDVGDMDNRSYVSLISFKIGDALSIGVALEGFDSNSAPGSAFGSIDYGSYNPSSSVSSSGPLAHNLGIKANFNSGLINAGIIVLSGGEKENDDAVATSTATTGYEATVSGFGLGVGLNIGALKPYLNLFSPTTTSKNNTGEDETTNANTQIGVDLALGESSGVGLSIVNRTSTRKDTPSSGTSTETEQSASETEVGFSTKLGGAALKAGLVTSNYKHSDSDEVGVTWLRVRLQQGF